MKRVEKKIWWMKMAVVFGFSTSFLATGLGILFCNSSVLDILFGVGIVMFLTGVVLFTHLYIRAVRDRDARLKNLVQMEMRDALMEVAVVFGVVGVVLVVIVVVMASTIWLYQYFIGRGELGAARTAMLLGMGALSIVAFEVVLFFIIRLLGGRTSFQEITFVKKGD